MNEDHIRLHCLKIAAERNQKLNADPADVVNEAEIYADFVNSGFTKSNQVAKKKTSKRSA